MPFREAGAEGNEVTTSSGLQYVDLTIGTGAMAEAGQTVTVHYTGWLENGKQIRQFRGPRPAVLFSSGRWTSHQGMG